MPTNPPIRCTPCRVKVDGAYYRVRSNGGVYRLHIVRQDLNGRPLEFTQEEFPLLATDAREVRREASRLRRNRNARERNQAMRDLGMVKTPFGWE